jgi:hypothetical protein
MSLTEKDVLHALVAARGSVALAAERLKCVEQDIIIVLVDNPELGDVIANRLHVLLKLEVFDSVVQAQTSLTSNIDQLPAGEQLGAFRELVDMFRLLTGMLPTEANSVSEISDGTGINSLLEEANKIASEQYNVGKE